LCDLDFGEFNRLVIQSTGPCFRRHTETTLVTEVAITAEGRPAAPESSRTPSSPGSRPTRDLYLYALLTALVLGAWGFTRLGLYSTKSDTAYWLGVAGGVGMLLLLSYPMRKHLRFMQRTGEARYWFVGHMVLGVGGPLLILLHSNFQIGSLNAGVAFFSMVIVALSGVIGRFLYLRLHRGLSGQKLDLKELSARLVADDGQTARLRFAPGVVERCLAFEKLALERRTFTGAEVLRAMVLVPLARWRTQQACRKLLRRRLVAVAHTEGWTRSKLRRHQTQAQRLVGGFLARAQRVAMFSAWEKLFSWWHVAHVPFVYLLVISAIVHVIAVHAY
jgi:hypothetical protein